MKLWQCLWGSVAGLLLVAFHVMPALQWERLWCFWSSLCLEPHDIFPVLTLYVKKLMSAVTLRRWHWRWICHILWLFLHCLLSGLNREEGRKWCNHSLFLSQRTDWTVCTAGCFSLTEDVMIL